MGLLRRHWPFAIALAGAAGVRVLVMLAFRPVIWFGGDSASYLATGLRLTPDPSRVGGYGFMLWVLRPLHSFALVAGVQHLMGLAMGVLIYLLARRYGLPAWAATLAAIPVLFDAYQLQLESDALPDVPFGFLVMLALYLLLRSPGERRLRAGTALGGIGGVGPPEAILSFRGRLAPDEAGQDQREQDHGTVDRVDPVVRRVLQVQEVLHQAE